MRVILDASVLVGRIDARDVHHSTANAVCDLLEARAVELIYLDCVVIESIGVICRRRAERRTRHPLPDLAGLFTADRVTRAYPLLKDGWEDILNEVVLSDGKLNAHDGLLLAWARRAGSPIATFDLGLRERGVAVLSSVSDVERALGG